MNKAALPKYMEKHLKNQDIPPGHWFGLYFQVWQDDWKKADKNKTDALKKSTCISPPNVKMMEAICQRQQAAALQQESLVYFPAKSTSPFVTGLGNEHPLENGFAFLNPYGLPYLPGSGVKGVLRSVAEELALGIYDETHGWDMLAVWWLFGFEANSSYLSKKPYSIDILDEEAERRRQAYQQWVEQGNYDQKILEHFINMTVEKNARKKYQQQAQQFLLNLPEDISNQGSLHFWDVYPQSKQLAMDILTPHHGDYFQGKHAPHDSEQPNPNIFLTVPPSCQFDFYCTNKTVHLPLSLQNCWQNLLKVAFYHAFDWLGFGAKTAVGYGQMQNDDQAVKKFKHEAEKQQQLIYDKAEKEAEEKRLDELPKIEQEIAKKLQNKTDPNKKDYLILLNSVKKDCWQGQDRKAVLDRIKVMMQQAGSWKETTQKKKPEKDKAYQLTLEVIKLMD